jgi:predicted nuclease of predicted toxin-antitoxin system
MNQGSKVKLYIDEDVWGRLAAVLRDRGYDALDVHEANREALSDEEQLAYAVSQGRAILTYNKQDFVPLAREYFYAGQPHFGIIISCQLEPGELLHRVLNLLNSVPAEEIKDLVIPLEAYK